MSEPLTTLCPLCWRPETTKVEGDLPCVECQEAMKKGFLLIGVDFSKSESTEKAIRTGHRWIIKPEAAALMYNEESLKKGAGLIDLEEVKQLGLPVQKFVKAEPEMKAELTLCGVCQKPIKADELGGIDPKIGFMHKTCTPLKLL